MPATIPAWIPPLPAADDLNEQNDINVSQATVLAEGELVPVILGTNQVGGKVFAVDYDSVTETWTVGVLWACLECESFVNFWINGEEPVAGVVQNNYLGDPTQTADPLLSAAISGYSDDLVLTRPGGDIGFVYSVFQYTNTHYPDFPQFIAEIEGALINSGVFSETPAHALGYLIEDCPIGPQYNADATSLAAVVADNDATVATEPRRRIGLVMDKPLRFEAWLRILAGYASCWITKRGPDYFFASDRPASSVASLDSDDWIDGSFSIQGPAPGSIPTQVEIVYTDTSESIWRSQTVVEALAGVSAGTVPRRVSRVSMPGITRHSQATREAIERLKKLQNGLTIGFDAFDDQLARETGDVIDITRGSHFAADLFRVIKTPEKQLGGAVRIQAMAYDATVYDDSEPAAPSFGVNGRYFGDGVLVSAAGVTVFSEGASDSGIWIDRDALAALPQSGAAWTRLAADANSTWGTADLTDQDQTHDVLVLSGALYAAVSGDAPMLAKTQAALDSLVGATLGDALEVSRAMQAYVIAADLINYRPSLLQDEFRSWIDANINGHSTANSIRETAQRSANNWGGMARAALSATGLYLSDQSMIDDAVQGHLEFIGEYTGTNPQMIFTDSPDQGYAWHYDPADQAGVNRADAGFLSGVIPEDWRRDTTISDATIAGFTQLSDLDAVDTIYLWEAMQGFVVAAVLLHRARLIDINTATAVERAVTVLYDTSHDAVGDDTWIPPLLNQWLGLSLTETAVSEGKGMGYTDLTSQVAASQIGPTASAPGDWWINESEDNALYLWSGLAWVPSSTGVAGGGGSGIPGADGRPGLSGASVIYEYDNLETGSVGDSTPGEYGFSTTQTTQTLTSTWATIIGGGVASIFLHESDRNGIDRSTYLDQLVPNGVLNWYFSSGKWVDFLIDAVIKVGNIYEFQVTVLEYDQTDDQDNLSGTDGVVVLFRFGQAVAGVDGDEGQDGTNSARTFTLLINRSRSNGASVGELSLVGVNVDGTADFTSTEISFFLWNGTVIQIPHYSASTTIQTQLASKTGFICVNTLLPGDSFTISGTDIDIAFVYKEAGQWYYDNNSSTPVAFTPTDDYVAIGWLETGGADTIVGGGIFGEAVTLTLAPTEGAQAGNNIYGEGGQLLRDIDLRNDQAAAAALGAFNLNPSFSLFRTKPETGTLAPRHWYSYSSSGTLAYADDDVRDIMILPAGSGMQISGNAFRPEIGTEYEVLILARKQNAADSGELTVSINESDIELDSGQVTVATTGGLSGDDAVALRRERDRAVALTDPTPAYESGDDWNLTDSFALYRGTYTPTATALWASVMIDISNNAGSLGSYEFEWCFIRDRSTRGAVVGETLFDGSGNVLEGIDVQNDLAVLPAVSAINRNPSFREFATRNGTLGPQHYVTNDISIYPYYVSSSRDLLTIGSNNATVNMSVLKTKPGIRYEVAALVRSDTGGATTIDLRCEGYEAEALPYGKYYIGSATLSNGMQARDTLTTINNDALINTAYRVVSGVYTPPAGTEWFSPSLYSAGDAFRVDWWIVREVGAPNIDYGGLIYNSGFSIVDNARGAPAGWYISSHPRHDVRTGVLTDGNLTAQVGELAASTMRFNSTAFPVSPNETYSIRVRLRDAAGVGAASGLYIRISEYDNAMPEGKISIGSNASEGPDAALIQEDSREILGSALRISGGVDWNDDPVPAGWTEYIGSYTPTASAEYASLTILNWSGFSGFLEIDRAIVSYTPGGLAPLDSVGTDVIDPNAVTATAIAEDLITDIRSTTPQLVVPINVDLGDDISNTTVVLIFTADIRVIATGEAPGSVGEYTITIGAYDNGDTLRDSQGFSVLPRLNVADILPYGEGASFRTTASQTITTGSNLVLTQFSGISGDDDHPNSLSSSVTAGVIQLSEPTTDFYHVTGQIGIVKTGGGGVAHGTITVQRNTTGAWVDVPGCNELPWSIPESGVSINGTTVAFSFHLFAAQNDQIRVLLSNNAAAGNDVRVNSDAARINIFRPTQVPIFSNNARYYRGPLANVFEISAGLVTGVNSFEIRGSINTTTNTSSFTLDDSKLLAFVRKR
tara:strand:+ start:7538 stop:13726 length:6189 start_codon:yes stop_codon:yes gene_type:complete